MTFYSARRHHVCVMKISMFTLLTREETTIRGLEVVLRGE